MDNINEQVSEIVMPVDELLLLPASSPLQPTTEQNIGVGDGRNIPIIPETANGLHIMPDQITVLNRLSQIREYKRQVLVMVDQLKRESENIDKETLRKLVNAYDSFKEQEDQYVMILQNILAFKQDQCDLSTEENMAPVGEGFQLNSLNDSDDDPLITLITSASAEKDKNKNPQSDVANSSSACSRMPNVNDIKLAQMIEQSHSLSSKHLELATLKSRLSSITALSEKTAEIELLENELENAESRAKLREIRQKELQDLRTPVFPGTENDGLPEQHMQCKNRDSLESFEAVDESSAQPTDADQTDQTDIKVTLERKYNELLATKKRIAEIQSMMSDLERKSTFLEQEKRQEESEIRMNNDLPTQEAPSDVLIINRPDFELERQRLADIKRRMMLLDDDQLIRVSSKVQPGVPDPPNNFTVDSGLEMQQIQRTRKNDLPMPVKQKNSGSQQLNNVRNLSDFAPCFITKSTKPKAELDSDYEESNAEFDYNLQTTINPNDNGNDTPTIGYAINDLDELFEDSAPSRPSVVGPTEKNIQKNPRLQSFRRNNDIALNTTTANNQSHYDKPVTSQQLDQNRRRRSFNEEKVQRKGVSNTDRLQNPTATNQRAAAALQSQKLIDRQFSSHAAYDSSNGANDPTAAGRRCAAAPQATGRRATNVDYDDHEDDVDAPPLEYDSSAPLFADPRYDQLARHMDSMRSIFDSLLIGQSQPRRPIKNKRAAPAPHHSQSDARVQPIMITSAPPIYRDYRSIFSDNGAGDDTGLMTSSIRSCRSDNNAALGIPAGLTRPYTDGGAAGGGASLAPPTFLLTNKHEYPLSGSERQLTMQLIACQQQMMAQQDELQRLRKICDDLTTNQDTVARFNNAVNATNALDGRPLSRTSLYHLLAPNPYLADSYNPQRPTNLLDGVSNVLPQSLNESFAQRLLGNEKSDQQYIKLGSKLSNLSQSGHRMPATDRSTAPPYRRAAILRDHSSSSVCLDAKSTTTGAGYDRAANAGGLDSSGYEGEPFDSLRESIYSEVATLISQNEQRPHYLLELFRELQMLSSDQLRVSGFRAIRDLLNRYLVEDHDNISILSERTVKAPPGTNSINNNSSMTSDDEQINKEQQKLINDKILSVIRKQQVESDSLKSIPDRARRMVNTNVKKKCARSASASMRHHKDHMSSFKMPPSEDYSKPTYTKNVLESAEPITKIYNDLTSFLNETDQDTVCDSGFLNFVKKFTLALVLSSNAIPYSAESVFFHKKLAADLGQRLTGFRGLLLEQCFSALLTDLQQVIKEHVTFYNLVQNVDQAIDNKTIVGDSMEIFKPVKTVASMVASRNAPPREEIIHSPCEIGEHLAYHEELKKIDNALAFIDDDIHDTDKEQENSQVCGMQDGSNIGKGGLP